MNRASRKRARVSYYGVEEPSFDEYIFCSSCGDYVYEYCSIHGALLVIPDDKVPTPTGFPAFVPRAALSIPHTFLHLAPSSIPDAGIGVFSTLTLPRGVRFGPYRGLRTDQVSSTYCWQIFDREHERAHVLDARDANKSNWMRYVNCSRHHSEQNLVAYQYRGQLYFRTIKIVPRFTELLVFYGSESADELNIDLRRYHSPAYTEILAVKSDATTSEQGTSNIKTLQLNTKTSTDNKSLVVNIQDSQKEHVDYNDKNNSVQQDNYVCDSCGQSFTEKAAIMNHVSTHNVPKNVENKDINIKVTKYSCSICDSILATGSDFINHSIKIHNSELKHKACTICDYKTVHRGDFARHMERHSGRRFECDMCKYVTDNSQRLGVHRRSHLIDNPHPCNICGIKFRTILGLHRHKQMQHYQAKPYSSPMWNSKCIQKTSLMTATIKNEEEQFPSNKFEHEFESKYSSDNKTDIQENQYSLNDTKVQIQENKFTCKTCKEQFNYKNKLNAHSMTHRTDRFMCTICKYRFNANSDLKRHAKVHSQEKPKGKGTS